MRASAGPAGAGATKATKTAAPTATTSATVSTARRAAPIRAAPAASSAGVGGVAEGAPTWNVRVPPTGWPSSETTRQDKRCVPSARSAGGATVMVAFSAVPSRSVAVPSGPMCRRTRGAMASLKSRMIAAGASVTTTPSAGSEPRNCAWASACSGRSARHNRIRRRRIKDIREKPTGTLDRPGGSCAGPPGPGRTPHAPWPPKGLGNRPWIIPQCP